MIDLRPFSRLGGRDHGWLDTRHHFSFADYYDADRMHWGNLRVWNDDVIAPGTGFPLHRHRDMEIITYVREGAITHQDNLGNKGRTVAGNVKVMSAGTGIAHAEYNHEAIATSIFQIWIIPDRIGEQPTWGTRSFPKAERDGRFVVLASGRAADGGLPIRADARVLGAALKAGQSAQLDQDSDHKAYLVPASGTVEVNNVPVQARDGLAVAETDHLRITAIEDSEIVLVDVGR